MPTTRIPIDGLWRCLCPIVDTIGPGYLWSRTIPRKSATPRIGSKTVVRPRQFHSSTRSKSLQWGGGVKWKLLEIPSAKQPDESTNQTQRWSPLAPETQKATALKDSVRALWDDTPIAQLHDRLRLMRTYAGRYNDVVKLVEYLILERGETPALIHYDSLIRANADAEHGDADVVKNLLEEMKQEGVVPDSGVYHSILLVLANHPDYLLREQIMIEMKERWFGLSPDGWHNMIIGLIRDRQYEIAMDKLEQMHSDEITVRPWLYDIFMFQLCEGGELNEVLRLLEFRYSVQRDEIVPSVWYYLLDKFSNAFHYEGTSFIWKRKIETFDLVPSDGMCLSTLNLAARHSDPTLATSCIKILSNRQSALASHHYEALLTAYVGAQDLKTSFRILTIMAKAGIVPDSNTTRPIFLYLTSSPDLPFAAWDVIKKLEKAGHFIPTASGNVILESLVADGNVEEAVTLYKQLHNICLAGPDTETFNILLQRVTKARQIKKEVAMFLAAEMAALGVKPNYLTYDRLILCCANSDDYEDAFRYLEEMIVVGEENKKLKGHSWRENVPEEKGWWMRRGTAGLLVKICITAGDERAWDLIAEMEERGLTNPALNAWADKTWKEREEKERVARLEAYIGSYKAQA